MGLVVDDVDFGLAILTPTLATVIPGMEQYAPKFVSAKAFVGSAQLVGIDEELLEVEAHDVEVNINTFVVPSLGPVGNGILQLFGPPSIDYQASFASSPEDKNGNGLLDAGEDRDGDGVLDAYGLALPAGGNNAVILDFAEEIVQAKVGYAQIDLAGFVQLSGSMAFTKKGSERVTLSDGTETTITSLAVGINDAYGFIGVGGYWQDANGDGRIDETDAALPGGRDASAVGLAIEDLDLGVLLAKELVISAEGVDVGVYLAAQASVTSVGLVGIDDVVLTAEDLVLEINTGARFSLGIGQFVRDAETGAVSYDENVSVSVALTTIDFSKSTHVLASSPDVTRTGYAIPTGNPDEPIVLNYAGQFLRVQGEMQLDVFGFVQADGVIDITADDQGLTAFLDAGLTIGTGDFSFDSHATGLLVIRDGIALGLELSTEVDLGDFASLNAHLDLKLNSFEEEITYQVPERFRDKVDFDSYTIPATPPGRPDWEGMYVALSGEGSLSLLDDALKLDGQFAIIISESGMELSAAATLDLPVFEPLSVAGSLLFVDGGLAGSFEVGNPGDDGGSLLIDGGVFEIRGGFRLQVNTTASIQQVRALELDADGQPTGALRFVDLDPESLRIQGSASVAVGGVEMRGAMDILVTGQGLQASADLTLDLDVLGSVAISGAITILDTDDEGLVFALKATSHIDIGISSLGLSADATLEINTSDLHDYAGVAAGTLFNLELDGAISILAFDVDFHGGVSVVNDVFRLEFDAGLDFFGVFDVDIGGYIQSDGDFQITGSAHLGLDMGIIELNAGMSMTFGYTQANGFLARATVYGSLDISIDLGLFEIHETLAGFEGTIELTETSAYLSARVTVVGISVSGSHLWSWGDPPQISHMVGDTLYLHMGDDPGRYWKGSYCAGGRASERNLYDDTVHEAFNVYKVDDQIVVQALGVKETYAAGSVKKIVAYGGAGNDSIVVAPEVQAVLEFDGGAGDDNFIVGGGLGSGLVGGVMASSVVRGGAGDDRFTGGSGHGIRYEGGAGNDRFVGGEADEIVDMGSGNNSIFTAGGNDEVRVDGGTNTVDLGDGDDIIRIGTVGTLTLAAGRGNDLLMVDSFVSTGTLTLGSHSLQLAGSGGTRTVNFDGGLERIELRDLTTGTTRIATTADHDWGRTDLALKTDGVADVRAATFRFPDGRLALSANGVQGTLNTQLAELSVLNTGATFSDLVVREHDDLVLLSDAFTGVGLSATRGGIDIELAGREALLTLASGVLSAGGSGRAIRIVADDVDFASGADQVTGSGTLTLKAQALGQNYRVGAAAQTTYGADLSGVGETGYFDFSMTDLSALRDGFTEIILGHRSANGVFMAVGDVEDKTIDTHVFSARLTDAARFVADDYRIMGDVQSSQSLLFEGRTMEVMTTNVNDPMAGMDSGVRARSLGISLTEQIVVSGWLIGDDALDIVVNGSTGAHALVRYGAEVNSFTADAGSIIYSENANSRVSIQTSGSIYSGTAISARHNGSQVVMKAGTGFTLLQGSAVAVQGNNGSILLEAGSYLHLDAGSAILSGARSDFVDGSPVYTATGSGTTLTLRSGGEMTLDGSITANGSVTLDAGQNGSDRADYFDTLDGRTLSQTADPDTIAALLANLTALAQGSTGTIDPRLLTLVAQGQVNLGATATVRSIANYLPWSALSVEARKLVAQTLGYSVHEDGGFHNASAPGAHFVEQLAEGVSNTGYTEYTQTIFFKADAPAGQQLVFGFTQGTSADYSNARVDWAAWGATAPAAGAGFDSLSAVQKIAVAQSLGYEPDYENAAIDWAAFGTTRPVAVPTFAQLSAAQKQAIAASMDFATPGAVKYFNYNAPIGRKIVTTFSQGPVVDYSNADIYWGNVAAPAAGTSFASLSQAQQRIVAAALGYEMHTGTNWYKADAPAGLQLVKGFASGPVQFAIDGIDWGGVRPPAADASFEDLTPAQRARVAAHLGYDIVDQQMFYKPSAPAGEQLLAMPIEGVHYRNADIAWGSAKDPGQGVAFDRLSLAQQDKVLEATGYRRFGGVVYHDAQAALPADRYRLTFVAGSDYENADIAWSSVAIPDPGTAFADMTAEQQFRVLSQTGWERYEGTVFFKAGASREVATRFTEGVDYRNADIDWSQVQASGGGAGASAAGDNRWVLTDGTRTVVVVAVDSDNDGSADVLRVTEPHELLGQRGFGFLLTGTITNLADHQDLVVTSDHDVIVRGNVNLLGAGSDLAMQSDRWLYWEGEAEIRGDIDLRGGVLSDGSNLGGANDKGVSLYVHATATLNSLDAGTAITLMGGRDVVVNGRVVAGGTIGDTGIAWAQDASGHNDSSISVTAGEKILVDTVLAAGRSVTLRTTGTPGADDAGLGVRLSSAGGLTAAGLASDGSAARVAIEAVGRVEVIGVILSGGDLQREVVDGQTVETLSWSDDGGTVLIHSQGQVALGGLAPTASGGLAEIGSTVRAGSRIDVIGGTSADGIGVKMPGGARLVTHDADGIVTITAEKDADILGLVVAGGEVIDHYDSLGFTLGSTRNTFGGESQISVSATGQVRLGRDLLAGKAIDVRGGAGRMAAIDTSLPADEQAALASLASLGVVVGGNVHLLTWGEFSSVTLSSSGNLSVLAPAWQRELVAQGFAEFADGHISQDASLLLTVNGVTRTITVRAADTAGNAGVGGLAADLEAAIAAQFGAGIVDVRLDDGRLLLTSDYDFTVGAVLGDDDDLDSVADDVVGGAQRLGFTQVGDRTSGTAAAVAGARRYAIDAAERGSVVNLGKADAPSGEITISGAVRGHSGIHLYAGSNANGSQKVTLTESGLMETLAGGMTLNPAGDTILRGDLVARGRGSDIIINATRSIELHGDLTAQRDIVVTAGQQVVAGEASIRTYSTAVLDALDARGRIILTGLNDVLVDSHVGTLNPELGLVDIRSVAGDLTVTANAVVETGTSMVLGGVNVDLQGWITTHSATPASYDYELSIVATGDVQLRSTFELSGSMHVQAGDDIGFIRTLQALGAGQKLVFEAGGDIGIGKVFGATEAAVLEADLLIDLRAGGAIALGDAQLFTRADHSSVVLRGNSLSIVDGGVYAGAQLDAGGASYSWTGRGAAIEIRTAGSALLGDTSSGTDEAGTLAATGRVSLQAGTDNLGLGFSMTRGSAVRTDAAGVFGVFGEAGRTALAGTPGDSAIDLHAEGDLQVRGLVGSVRPGFRHQPAVALAGLDRRAGHGRRDHHRHRRHRRQPHRHPGGHAVHPDGEWPAGLPVRRHAGHRRRRHHHDGVDRQHPGAGRGRPAGPGPGQGRPAVGALHRRRHHAAAQRERARRSADVLQQHLRPPRRPRLGHRRRIADLPAGAQQPGGAGRLWPDRAAGGHRAGRPAGPPGGPGRHAGRHGAGAQRQRPHPGQRGPPADGRRRGLPGVGRRHRAERRRQPGAGPRRAGGHHRRQPAAGRHAAPGRPGGAARRRRQGHAACRRRRDRRRRRRRERRAHGGDHAIQHHHRQRALHQRLHPAGVGHGAGAPGHLRDHDDHRAGGHRTREGRLHQHEHGRDAGADRVLQPERPGRPAVPRVLRRGTGLLQRHRRPERLGSGQAGRLEQRRHRGRAALGNRGDQQLHRQGQLPRLQPAQRRAEAGGAEQAGLHAAVPVLVQQRATEHRQERRHDDRRRHAGLGRRRAEGLPRRRGGLARQVHPDA